MGGAGPNVTVVDESGQSRLLLSLGSPGCKD